MFRKKTEILKGYIARKGLNGYAVRRFRKLIRDFYRNFGRNLPWRGTEDPYRILVSEIMLQQTQVHRVCTKYAEFIQVFPDFRSLARASVKDVLSVWKGLGYNKRALALRETAIAVERKYKGYLPDREEELIRLPGIGPATAADIMVFAFNRPALVVETNIRAVYIHLFFSENEQVDDRMLRPLVARTMDRKDPRGWYNGLMDLGTWIKKEYGNPASRSRHYTKQSSFEGSNRQMRSRILTFLMENGASSADSISRSLSIPAAGIEQNLRQMAKEGFVKERKAVYSIQD